MKPIAAFAASAVYSPIATSPSAPPMPDSAEIEIEIEMGQNFEVAPADIIMECGPVPDRIVRESLDKGILRSNHDGDRIVFSDKVAILASQNTAKNIHTSINSKVMASNRDSVDDLSVSAPVMAQPIEEDNRRLDSDGSAVKILASASASEPYGLSNAGYTFSEYRSVYDQAGGYQPQEYKSMYE